MLAGISADYYLRLEQGRDHNPSIQVLEALARVLQLDQAATDYLISLAAPQPRQRRRRPKREIVPDGVRQLLDVLSLPAFVEGRYFDVLASNRSRLRAVPQPAGRQEPAPRRVPGPRRARRCIRTGTRPLPGWSPGSGNPSATTSTTRDSSQLVGELSLSSERFRQLWARHDVQAFESAAVPFNHPQVGELVLGREKLAIKATAGQLLVIYHAEPGSGSAEKLALLASLASSTEADAGDAVYQG